MPRQQLEDVLSPTNDNQSAAGWDELPKGKAKDAAAMEDHLLPQVPDKFRVHDEKTANWVVRKVVEARNYAKKAKEWAEREVMRTSSELRPLRSGKLVRRSYGYPFLKVD